MSGTAPFTVSHGIATITLDRPDRRNAISWELVTDLLESLAQARRREDVRVLVLTGAGTAFSVGADMMRVGSGDAADQGTRTLRGQSESDDIERLSRAAGLVEQLIDFPAPTIAAVNGACAGAGLCLALATDVQIIASHAVVNTAFVSAAVSGDLGSAWLLTRAVGPARAAALLLDPVKMTAQQAVDVGLMSERAEDLPARVGALTHKFARQAPRAMRLARQNLRDAATMSLADYLPRETARMVECSRTQDATRAARAFIDRTQPDFAGD